MTRCKNCAFFEGVWCWRVFDETGKLEDLVLVDEDKEPCSFAVKGE